MHASNAARLAGIGAALLAGCAGAEAAEAAEAGSWLTRTYRAGGWFMHPLLLSALVAGAVTIERAWAAWRDRADRRRLVRTVTRRLGAGEGAAAAAEAAGERGPLARVLAHGLARLPAGREPVVRGLEAAATVEVYQMERGLLWLATVANVAPLLGFLGTVSGMIHAFEDIAAADQVSARIVASGISEALLTTATGLVIAIPTQAAYNFFVGRIERFSVEVEEAADDLLQAWDEGRGAA